jgi:hypothetical protein
MTLRTVFFVLLATFAISNQSYADVTTKAVQEALEFTARRFGKEVAEEGIEKLGKKMTTLAAKHGDEVVTAAFKKIGPRAGQLANAAGDQADVALRVLARYGDDGVSLATKPGCLKLVSQFGDDGAAALLRHGTVGEQVIGQFAEGGVKALSNVSAQSGRRLAMMAGEDVLKPELMDVICRHGDKACDFIWRNKGALAVGTTLAAFVAAPESFIEGTSQLTGIIANSVAQPIAEVPKVLAEGVARSLSTLAFVVGMFVLAITVLLRNTTKQRLMKGAWYVFRGFTTIRNMRHK